MFTFSFKKISTEHNHIYIYLNFLLNVYFFQKDICWTQPYIFELSVECLLLSSKKISTEHSHIYLNFLSNIYFFFQKDIYWTQPYIFELSIECLLLLPKGYLLTATYILIFCRMFTSSYKKISTEHCQKNIFTLL